jgi:hypothetical protein
MGVVVERKSPQNVVVFVTGLAIVAALLLVPVVAVRVTIASLLGWGVDVTAILSRSAGTSLEATRRYMLTRFGSSSSCTSAGTERARTWVNRGRAATEVPGTRERASGRAATMRREIMLRNFRMILVSWKGEDRTWRRNCWECLAGKMRR